MESPNSEIDWEFVPISDENPQFSTNSSSDDVFGGVIRSDYFSIDSGRTETDVGDVEVDEDGSDDPNWVDPSSTNITVGGNHCDRCFDSSSPSCDSNSSEINLMISIQNHSQCCNLGFECNSSEIAPKSVDFGEKTELKQEEDHVVVDDKVSESIYEVESEGRSEDGDSEDDGEKKRGVWWKIPVEVLRYCVMRVNPVWSLSMAAAALMGFVILRRRFLYRMKRKSLGIHQLNVSVDDDKKVSQFMSRAARLNEAFSVVKRVPIIRPALPAPGMAPWPVMSFR
ncbi:hypothetical protein vseg_018834 [Gypsophila vaccaria]